MKCHESNRCIMASVDYDVDWFGFSNREHAPLYLLSVLAAAVGVGYFLFGVYTPHVGGLEYALFIVPVIIAALAVRAGGGFASSFILGTVPMYGLALGLVFVLPREAAIPLYRNAFHALLLVSIIAIPLATLGFVLGSLWRYGTGLRTRLNRLLVRIGLAAVVTVLLLAAERWNLIGFGGMA